VFHSWALKCVIDLARLSDQELDPGGIEKPVPCNNGAKKRKRTAAVDMSYDTRTRRKNGTAKRPDVTTNT
jgi:hypothetical protein